MKQFNHGPHGGAVAHAVHEMRRWWWSDVEQTWRAQSAVRSGGGQTDVVQCKFPIITHGSQWLHLKRQNRDLTVECSICFLFCLSWKNIHLFVTSMLDLSKLGFSKTLTDALINDWHTYLWHVQVGRSHFPPSNCGSSILATSHRQKTLSDSNNVCQKHNFLR